MRVSSRSRWTSVSNLSRADSLSLSRSSPATREDLGEDASCSDLSFDATAPHPGLTARPLPQAGEVTNTSPKGEMHSAIPYFQSSVLNGEAGRPSLFARLGSASSCQANRTATGFLTASACTTTESPTISAFASTNFLSSPAIVK